MFPLVRTDSFTRAWATNRTVTGFAAISDSATALTGPGYFSLNADPNFPTPPGTVTPGVKLKFFGTGADDSTASCRVYGVAAIPGGFTHVLLAQFDLVLSTDLNLASERYADTITRIVGIDNVSHRIISPGGNVSGHVIVDAAGFHQLYIEPICGTATGINALVARV